MKVAAIIPAFNEVKTVRDVVRVVQELDQVSEVIVVDDGSTDGTEQAAREAGARVIRLEKNVGKGGAMKAGMLSTDAELCLFLDADLVGLGAHHILALIGPVLSGDADMTIGIFEKSRAATDAAQRITPWLSGQRAVRRKLLDAIRDIETSRYGIEVVLTREAKRRGARIKYVPLTGLTHVMKEEKRGFIRGFIHRLRMYYEIIGQALARR